MKIIHTADLHLDSKMESNLSGEKAHQRRGELLLTFERLVDYAAENEVRVILIAGDLFDKPHIRKAAKNRVMDQIETHPWIDFVYLRGNHDKCDFLSGPEELPENLKCFTHEEWTSYSYGDIVITGREINGENARNLPVNLILDASKFNIVTLHGQETSYVGRDRTEVVNIPDFKNKNIDYLALGHIHSYKTDRLDDRGTYCYSGCLEGRGFDECGEKGFVLLDIDEEDHTCSSRFIPFAGRTLHEVSVEVKQEDNMPAIIASVERETAGIPERDFVKIVLNGKKEIDFDIDTERLLHIFAPRFFFIRIKDRTEVAVDYDSFLNDRSLKGEFVRLLQAQDMNEEERGAIVELGMKAILGEELSAGEEMP